MGVDKSANRITKLNCSRLDKIAAEEVMFYKIVTVGVQLSSCVVCLKVDTSLVEPASYLDVSTGPHELSRQGMIG